MSLKVVSINMEGNKHLESVADFLEREQADVVCLMEACQAHILELAGAQYPFAIFAKNDVLGNIEGLESIEPTGVAILAKEIPLDVEKEYFGETPRVRVVERGSGSHAPVMLSGTIAGLRLAVLHFTWTKKGGVSIEQTNHLTKLLQMTKDLELVMCGDFNIPRGNDNYRRLVSQFHDNVPSEIKTTLDPVLHYANSKHRGQLQLVVDYVLSTPKYRVSEVKVIDGISDHCGLVFRVDLF